MICIGNDWDKLLAPEWNKEYYQRLREFLKTEYKTQTVYPDMYDLFSALKATPYEKVKVVILGQDPYHEPGQAHGMCFSVKPGVPAPPSLQNIFKELNADLGCPIPNNGYLEKWAHQGVLLLNTVLTVRKGQANSHAGKGWEILTDRIISLLSEREDPIVFLLWGKHAQDKAQLINQDRHVILKAPHPSPLSASRGFLGCRHFSQANENLISFVKTPIDWTIENI